MQVSDGSLRVTKHFGLTPEVTESLLLEIFLSNLPNAEVSVYTYIQTCIGLYPIIFGNHVDIWNLVVSETV